MFELIYNFQSHNDFHKTYKRIVKSYYMRYLIRKLKRYILYCSQCQLN